MLNKVTVLPDELGGVETMLADSGYFSAANVAACVAAEIEPLIAMGRQSHYPPLGSSPRAGSTGVRHHQVGAGIPAVPAAQAGPCAGRVEPRDHGPRLRRGRLWNMKRLFALCPAQ
jgi:hypothetical protein